MTPDWFTQLALAVVRNMDYGTPYVKHVEALWAELERRRCLIPQKGEQGYGHHEMYPWPEQWDAEAGIEEQRRRYWVTTPFADGEREAILKRWNPPHS